MEKTETKDPTHWPPFFSVFPVRHREKARAPGPVWTSALGALDPHLGPAGDVSENFSLSAFSQELVTVLCFLLAPFLDFHLVLFSSFGFFPAFAGCSFPSCSLCAWVLQSPHLGIPHVGQLLPKEQTLELAYSVWNLDSEAYELG